ncbi:MAE_28990/MAE_18760 family HEPN-like nuclease [Vibrio cyclitrophicus]|nr:MAE_28990/MAE_18760 family HEPN-like nuclease [Vibrio cyclitrophicus]PMJ97232.1 hypothetical protein BCU11_13050 [Vibrio cyclitrophicus]
MFETRQEFNERKDEIVTYFKFLDDLNLRDAKIQIPQNLPRRPSVELSSTLKSGGVLMLYNLVESTVTDLIKLIHQKFTDEQLKYNELNKEIQLLWFSYYYKNIKEGNIKDDGVLLKMKMIHDTWSETEPISFTFDEYTKYKTGSTFSGNLDAREIRNLLSKYGLSTETSAPELKAIKENRNKLAHGEISFSQCGRDLVPDYYNKLKDQTILFLDTVMSEVEVYLNEQKFRR